MKKKKLQKAFNSHCLRYLINISSCEKLFSWKKSDTYQPKIFSKQNLISIEHFVVKMKKVIKNVDNQLQMKQCDK